MHDRTWLEKFENFNGFAKHIGVELMEAENGRAMAKIELQKRHGNPIGSVHGGCLFTLADMTAGMAIASTGVSCTTLSAHMVYLNAAMMDKTEVIYAIAEPVRNGKKIAVYKVKISDNFGRTICELTVEFYIMSKQLENAWK